jgi:hypothetical protein
MRAVVVYESMFGATRQVAEAIADGLGGPEVAQVVPVQDASADLVAAADLLVVGGPTHVHGMARPRSRNAAVEMTRRPGKRLQLEPGATGPGLREWFEDIPALRVPAAAFDTKMSGPWLFTGRASHRIGRLLKKRGARVVVRPRSFLVAKDELVPGQLDAARTWGKQLAEAAASDQAAA